MKFTLISPRVAIQKGDFLGSGVPYWPIELATLAAFVRQRGDTVGILDLFGRNPRQLADAGDCYLQGESIEIHLESTDLQGADAFVLYAISYMSHLELLLIAARLRKSFPYVPIAVLENTQAVTAYSLPRVAASIFDAGADLLICGEPYINWEVIKRMLLAPGIEPVPVNVLTRESIHAPQRLTSKKMCYPVPAWDLVNLEGYWSLPYSHGPKTWRYLPVLTSRGCPFACDFCVVPETNQLRWHGNAPAAVVEELITLRDRFDVHDFQIEDLNPTVQHTRWEKICEMLIERQANIRFYFVSGTKAETLHVNTIPLFASAGCKFVSISPESGSTQLMKKIGKPFNHQHGIDLVAACRAHGIRTQACLLVGHPSESDQDHEASAVYLRRLVHAGLDEVAVFIVAPFAGSKLYATEKIVLRDSSALPSFSPKGRAGYANLQRRRRALIRTFFMSKLLKGFELWRQGVRALCGVPQTKMENLPRRMAFIYWQMLRLNFAKMRDRI